ncbi:uncharacterized protein LOC111239234 isoform X2 [Seriola dumerili]|uniref:uncharacterized protein LOC111239234 isoform X2 n=1 Tax=Seriola dumerili TaxID=41447 RepID=UPI000BBF25F9|nr:uncharacterized protein LOC111239234 isoform X2 [Seriola dumerili]
MQPLPTNRTSFTRPREKSTHMYAPAAAPVGTLSDHGYQSDYGSDSGLSDIRSTCSSTQTITESDKSRDTPPFFQDKPRRVRSKGKDTTLLSKIESIVADLMKCEASPVVVAVSLVAIAAVLCFVGSLFTRERGATPEVKIVLPSYSGEGKITAETDMMLKQVIEELKKEVERRVRSEIQAKKDTSEATESSGFIMSIISFFFRLLIVLFIFIFFYILQFYIHWIVEDIPPFTDI